MGKISKPISMVMNLLIRTDSIHDRRSIHQIFVSQLDKLIIGETNKAHEISFALNQACRYIILNSRIFRSVLLNLMNANEFGEKLKTCKCQSCNHFMNGKFLKTHINGNEFAETHINGNEFADSYRFNPQSQIYSSNIC